MEPLRVCIIGSGNWGSAIAKVIGNNIKKCASFQPTVNMWVFEELIEGRKLTEIINQEHENIKYLPGHKLPHNVVRLPRITSGMFLLPPLRVLSPPYYKWYVPFAPTQGAVSPILQVVCSFCPHSGCCLPHITSGMFLLPPLRVLSPPYYKWYVPSAPTQSAVSPGVDEGPDGLKLISEIIREKLAIEMSVLMGANIASEVANEKFCETTIGKELNQVGGTGGQDINNQIWGSLLEIQCSLLPQESNSTLAPYRAPWPDILCRFPLFEVVYKICYEGHPVTQFISCLQNHPEHY
eukprot:XP_017952802.1 PREDICTED: glycerol-3-phosphate dehydrogenase 1-like protein [Xenopus tropicalis]